MLVNQNQTTALTSTTNGVTINPTEVMKASSDIIKNIAQDSKSDQLREYKLMEATVKNDLDNHSLSIKCKLHQNSNYLKDIVTIYESIPQLIDFEQCKPVMPEFDEIEVMKSDSAEIKRFIRKVNNQMLGFHCNHKTMNEACDKVYKVITDIYESAEFKQYHEFIERLVYAVIRIRRSDSYNQIHDTPQDIPNKFEVKKVIDIILKINGNISASNAKTCPECAKCKAAKRKYEYNVREIQRMRDELKEQIELLEAPAESETDMNAFMDKYYPQSDRIPLSDIKKRYNGINHTTHTFDQLTNLIVSTKRFTVTRSHNVYYVNRK